VLVYSVVWARKNLLTFVWFVIYVGIMIVKCVTMIVLYVAAADRPRCICQMLLLILHSGIRMLNWLLKCSLLILTIRFCWLFHVTTQVSW